MENVFVFVRWLELKTSTNEFNTHVEIGISIKLRGKELWQSFKTSWGKLNLKRNMVCKLMWKIGEL
jgi:hypothetical protein